MTSNASRLGRAAVAAVCALSLCSCTIAVPAWAETDASGQTQTGTGTQPSTGNPTDSSTGNNSSTDKQDKVTRYSTKVVLLKGSTEKVKFPASAGTVKANSSNKKVVKAARQGKHKFKLKARKNGKATVTFTSSTLRCKYKVTVASGDKFVNKWVKSIASNIKKSTKDVKKRLTLGSMCIISTFTYANVYDLKKVISKRKGNCNSAGQVLVKIYKELGYKAQVRSAIHDKMSRYPSGVIFGSNHYNVKVKAKGKTYFLDATPGMGFVYLSTPKKPLAAYAMLGDFWVSAL